MELPEGFQRAVRDEAREFVRDLSLDLSAGEKLLVTGPNTRKTGPLPGDRRAVDRRELGGSSGPKRSASCATPAARTGPAARPARHRRARRVRAARRARGNRRPGGRRPRPDARAARRALESEHDWPNALSPGEQQRLSFALALAHQAGLRDPRPRDRRLAHRPGPATPREALRVVDRLRDLRRGSQPFRPARLIPRAGRGRRRSRRARPKTGIGSRRGRTAPSRRPVDSPRLPDRPYSSTFA